MTLLKSLLGAVFLYFEKLKGEKTVYEVKLPKHALGHLDGIEMSGYRIRIYCQKKQFKRKYRSWLIPDKYTATYRVFSVVSNDAPEKLKEACGLDIDIPCQLSPFIDDEWQKEAAIQAYLDMLVNKLNPNPNKSPAA